MIKVGVIGYGFAAQTFHIPLILAVDGMQLTAISTSKPASVSQQHPSVKTFDTAEQLITSELVDLVVITAPNEVHFALAQLCLKNDKHVVVEKPMTTTCDEAQQLVALAQDKGLVLSVFHNRRWDGDFLTIKKLLAEKALGEVKQFESHFDRFRPQVRQRWREQPGAGSGIWYDLGPHLVDQALQLFGSPQSLTARCLTLRENSQATDYFHVLLHYPGLEVVLHASPFCAAPNSRYRVEGSQGSFIKYGLDPQEEQLKSGQPPHEETFGIESQESYGTLYKEDSFIKIQTERGRYLGYYQGLLEAVHSGKPNPVNPAEIVEVIQILELAEQSSRLGKTLPL